MSMVLHPRFAEAGRIRVWLGVTEARTAPALQWQLRPANASAAVPVTPTALQPLASVRGAELLNGDPPRVFAGLYEFENLAPGTAYAVDVQAGAESASLRTRSLPVELPSGADEWLNVLLVSCYHYFEATPFEVERAVRTALEECGGFGGHLKEFHLSVLMGDQVYLDLPTLQNFRTDARWLADKFEQDYRRNWFGLLEKTRPGQIVPTGYAAALAAAPAVCLPDDHEYWNNFPLASAFIENSWHWEDRQSWTQAAQALYRGFQGHEPTGLGEAVIVDLPPLSLFLADSRTFRGWEYQQRDSTGAHAFGQCLKESALARLRTWVADVNARNGFGIFVTGQSLLSEAKGGLGKYLADAELANFKDYAGVMDALTQLRNTAIYVTGDVHWGRLAELRDPGRQPPTSAYEIITSPAALVTTVGKDTLGRGWGAIKSLFGAKDPWPRHGKGSKAGEKFRPLPGRQFTCATSHLQEGDQLAVLSLQRQGTGTRPWVNVRLRYYPMHADARVRAEGKHEFRFSLRTPD